MRHIVILVILIAFIPACSNGYYGFSQADWQSLSPETRANIIEQRRQRLRDALQDMDDDLTESAILDARERQNEGRIVYPSPDYWQEQRAKQEYLQNSLQFPIPDNLYGQ